MSVFFPSGEGRLSVHDSYKGLGCYLKDQCVGFRGMVDLEYKQLIIAHFNFMKAFLKRLGRHMSY